MAQQLMLDIILNTDDATPVDVNQLKLNVAEYATKVTGDDNYEVTRDELRKTCIVELKR